DVAVGIDVDAGPREPAPVDDARVVERIAVDVVAPPDERRDGAHVRLVARRKEKRGLGTLEGGELRLDGGMQVEVPRDEPRGSRSAAVTLDRLPRRGPYGRMGREPEIVVGREQEVGTPVDHDLRVRRRVDGAEGAAEGGGLEARQLFAERGIEGAGGYRHAAVIAPRPGPVNRDRWDG